MYYNGMYNIYIIMYSILCSRAAEEIASVGIGMFESLKNYPLGGMNKSTGLDVLDKKKDDKLPKEIK